MLTPKNPPEKIPLSSMKKINKKGLELIKHFEGCKLSVYLDAVGLPTVGYGHMDKTMKVGTKITQEEANRLLEEDVARFERGVEELVTVQLNSNEFSALVCFSFNVGLEALKSSTLLKKVNGKSDAAAQEFLKWTRAGGKVLPGLVRRRQAEMELFLEPVVIGGNAYEDGVRV